jgi:Fe-S cluster biogenesis protein NfuA
MSAAQSVTATFNTTPVQFALTVTEAGTGTGSVSSSPAGISCPSICSANYNSGTPVTLTATAGTGSTFAGWSGACSGTGSCSVTMSAAQSVTATFNTTPVQFALSVTEAGTGTGSVSSSPAGISCPSICSANYNSGTPVTLTATAGTGSTFAGWSGACSGTGSCSVTMSAAKSVTATFNTTPVQFALTVSEAGTGTGSVTSTPTGISCPTTCSANYNSGTPVTLSAAAGSGSTFAGWSGACSGTGTCSVTMSQARAVTATFNRSGAEAPAISATIVNRGWYSSTILFVDLQLKNTGTGISLRTTLSQVAPSTVGGTGTVTYNTALSPALPIAAGTIGRGGAFKVRLYFNVASTVTKIVLTEQGSMSSSTGTALSYVQSQTLNR